jgi:hypothetical protein
VDVEINFKFTLLHTKLLFSLERSEKSCSFSDSKDNNNIELEYLPNNSLTPQIPDFTGQHDTQKTWTRETQISAMDVHNTVLPSIPALHISDEK